MRPLLGPERPALRGAEGRRSTLGSLAPPPGAPRPSLSARRWGPLPAQGAQLREGLAAASLPGPQPFRLTLTRSVSRAPVSGMTALLERNLNYCYTVGGREGTVFPASGRPVDHTPCADPGETGGSAGRCARRWRPRLAPKEPLSRDPETHVGEQRKRPRSVRLGSWAMLPPLLTRDLRAAVAGTGASWHALRPGWTLAVWGLRQRARIPCPTPRGGRRAGILLHFVFLELEAVSVTVGLTSSRRPRPVQV